MKIIIALLTALAAVCCSTASFSQAQPPVMLYCYVAGSIPARAVPCTDPSATPINVNGGGGTVTNPSVNKICDPTTPTICLNVKGASTAAVATDQSGVVQLNPLSPGIIALGQTTKSASVPVAVATDQTGSQTPANSISVVQAGYTYTHISTAATTMVKSGAGVLHLINVGTLGTVASTVTIYDNTAGSGTVIGVINSLTLSGGFPYDVAFSTGLTIVTTGTAAPDVTVSWR